MKKILFTLLIFALSQFTFGQTLDSLQGTWRFEGFYHTAEETVDSVAAEKMGKMFESLAFNFKSDGTITLSLFDKDEEASYIYDQKKKTVEVDNKKRKIDIIILVFDGNRMAVKFSDMKIWVKLE